MLIFNFKINIKKNLKLNFWNINLFAMFYDNEKFRNLKKGANGWYMTDQSKVVAKLWLENL